MHIYLKLDESAIPAPIIVLYQVNNIAKGRKNDMPNSIEVNLNIYIFPEQLFESKINNYINVIEKNKK